METNHLIKDILVPDFFNTTTNFYNLHFWFVVAFIIVSCFLVYKKFNLSRLQWGAFYVFGFLFNAFHCGEITFSKIANAAISLSVAIFTLIIANIILKNKAFLANLPQINSLISEPEHFANLKNQLLLFCGIMVFPGKWLFLTDFFIALILLVIIYTIIKLIRREIPFSMGLCCVGVITVSYLTLTRHMNYFVGIAGVFMVFAGLFLSKKLIKPQVKTTLPGIKEYFWINIAILALTILILTLSPQGYFLYHNVLFWNI